MVYSLRSGYRGQQESDSVFVFHVLVSLYVRLSCRFFVLFIDFTQRFLVLAV